MTKSILFVIGALLLAGCKKPDPAPPATPAPDTADHTAPVITLNGKIKDTISLQSNYIDPGQSAIDDKDGDITPFIVVSGTVNTGLIGNYSKEYNVRDAAGNTAKATRHVRVKNDVEFINGTYLVSCHCATITTTTMSTTTQQSNSSFTTDATALNANNVFSIKIEEGLFNEPRDMAVVANGNSIKSNVPTWESNITGVFSQNKNTFTMTTQWETTVYGPAGTRQNTCTSVYTKQ